MMDEPFGARRDRPRQPQRAVAAALAAQRTVIFVTHSIAEAVYLSTRIVVMSPRPGRITKIIESPLPFERDLSMRDSPEFARIAHELREALAEGHHERLERLKLHAVPVATLLVALLIVWYAAAIGMNSAGAIERVLAPKR